MSGILVLLTFGVTFGTALFAVGLSDEAAAGVSDISSSSGLENYTRITIFAGFFSGFISDSLFVFSLSDPKMQGHF